MAHLGTYSPWAKFVGGGQQYGYTNEQYKGLKRSAEIRRRRELEAEEVEREKLRSAEAQQRMAAQATLGSARIGAEGGIKEAGIQSKATIAAAKEHAAGETGAAGIYTRGALSREREKEAGATARLREEYGLKRELPESKLEELKLRDTAYNLATGGIQAKYGTPIEGPDGTIIGYKLPPELQSRLEKGRADVVAGRETPEKVAFQIEQELAQAKPQTYGEWESELQRRTAFAQEFGGRMTKEEKNALAAAKTPEEATELMNSVRKRLAESSLTIPLAFEHGLF